MEKFYQVRLTAVIKAMNAATIQQPQNQQLKV